MPLMTMLLYSSTDTSKLFTSLDRGFIVVMIQQQIVGASNNVLPSVSFVFKMLALKVIVFLKLEHFFIDLK